MLTMTRSDIGRLDRIAGRLSVENGSGQFLDLELILNQKCM